MDDKNKHGQGQGSQQDLKDDRNREETGKPMQLDEEKKKQQQKPGFDEKQKPGMSQGGQQQGGQQQGGQHQGGQGQTGHGQGGSQQGGQQR